MTTDLPAAEQGGPPSAAAGPWFLASLALAAAMCVIGLAKAYASPFVVQDDARQHVWWMRRFHDPGLFPGDMIADYFDGVAPIGYKALYQLLAWAGLDPIDASKLLPVALGLLATAYFFRLAYAIYPMPFAAFVATTMHTTRIWTQDDVISGTSRAFFHPLFLAFLYYLVAGARGRCLLVIALMGLFYPQASLLAGAILAVRLAWAARPWPPWRDVAFVAIAAAVSLATLLPFALGASRFDPVVTMEVARTMPEWRDLFEWPGHPDLAWWVFVTRDETGILPAKNFRSWAPWLALGLVAMVRWRDRFPALAGLRPAAAILPQVFVASVGMWVLAHLTLFLLYLPSRFTQHSLWVVTFLAAGVATAVAAATLADSRRAPRWAPGLVWAAALVVAAMPLWSTSFVLGSYVRGQEEELYRFVAALPKDVLIASISDEADNLPTFTRRSVLFSRETYNPFHLGFRHPARRRALDLIQAQYSPDAGLMHAFVRRYGVDYLLLDRNAFTLDYTRKNRTFFVLGVDGAPLLAGRAPALHRRRPGVVFESDGVWLLDARAL